MWKQCNEPLKTYKIFINITQSHIWLCKKIVYMEYRIVSRISIPMAIGAFCLNRDHNSEIVMSQIYHFPRLKWKIKSQIVRICKNPHFFIGGIDRESCFFVTLFETPIFCFSYISSAKHCWILMSGHYLKILASSTDWCLSEIFLNPACQVMAGSTLLFLDSPDISRNAQEHVKLC